jgi:hypothetical protein
LFSDETAQETITIDRAAGGDGQRYRVLASALLGKSMSPFVVRPTAHLADDPHPEHAGQEFVFVQGTGRTRLRGPDHQARHRRQRLLRRVGQP